MFKVKHKGNFNNTEKFFNRVLNRDYLNILDYYGQKGCEALAEWTPKDTGKTAASWDYEIESENGKTTICWTNSNVQDGVCVALLLLYGHGVNGGGFLQGMDYVDPALGPIFEEIKNKAWEEVTK